MRLELRSVGKRFHGPNGAPFWAVTGVDAVVETGERVGLVGESGSGKTTIGRMITGLDSPTEGEILVDGISVRRQRGLPRLVQMIFQDPFSSFNPSHSVGYSVRRPLEVLRGLSAKEAWVRATEQLERVGLTPAEAFRDVAPAQLSGGQRQRASIARAMAIGAPLLVADEPTSMLDVSVGAGIMNLLRDLSEERRLGLLFVTHNLAAARYLTERLIVLYRGEVVEEGQTDRLIDNPQHPYTQQLVAAAPDPDQRLEPGIDELPEGEPEQGWCRFASRCPLRGPDCTAPVALREVGGGRRVRCVRATAESPS